MNNKETKICVVCGKPFENRKKWKIRGIGMKLNIVVKDVGLKLRKNKLIICLK